MSKKLRVVDNLPITLSKNIICRFIHTKELNHSINFSDVQAVICILLEEMKKDLAQKKSIEIRNFGAFTLDKQRRRKHYSQFSKTMIVSEGNYKINFTFVKRIFQKIRKSFDSSKKIEEQKLKQLK